MDKLDMSTVLKACELVAKQRELNLIISGSIKGAAMAGFGACVAGILLGPRGFAIGGAVGGLVGTQLASKNHKPLCVVIREMSAQDREKLYQHMMTFFQAGKIVLQNGTTILALVMNAGSPEHQLIFEGLKMFFGTRLTA